MTAVFLDTESYSDLDIGKVGSARRAEHPSTDLLSVSYEAGAYPNHTWQWGQRWDDLDGLRKLLSDKSSTLVAHNAEHDWRELKLLADIDMPLRRVVDTASLAAIYNRPRSLEGGCKFYGIPGKFDSTVAKLFWQPMPKTVRGFAQKGDRVMPFDQPQLWAEALDYNTQDVSAMIGLWDKLSEEPIFIGEWEVWHATAQMNVRGVQLDWDGVEGALAIIESETDRLRERCMQLMGAYPTQRDRVLGWLNKRLVGRGQEPLAALQKHLVEEALAAPDAGVEGGVLDAVEREVLSIRQATSHSGPLGKLSRAVSMRCDDGRIHGQLLYAGTVTGRWASRGVQLHNLPRPKLKPSEMNRLWQLLAGGTRSLGLLRAEFGDDVLGVIAKNLRGMITPASGNTLTVCDLSKIEACIIDWYAGMFDVMRALALGGRDIYKETASAIYGVPIEAVTEVQRDLGKMTVLGCGYGLGWKGLQAQLFHDYGIRVSDALAQACVIAYRKIHKPVVLLWRKLYECSVMALEREALVDIEHGAYFDGTLGDELRLWLPSGRAICYPHARVEPINDVARIVSYQLPTGGRTYLQPPVLAEHIASGTARDLMARGIVGAEDTRLASTLTVHDELVLDDVAGCGEELHRIMTDLPEWAIKHGLVVGAEYKELMRYGK